jgi:hypothetical protein
MFSCAMSAPIRGAAVAGDGGRAAADDVEQAADEEEQAVLVAGQLALGHERLMRARRTHRCADELRPRTDPRGDPVAAEGAARRLWTTTGRGGR